MFFIVVGCGRLGAELCYSLYRHGHQVAVIDHLGSSFEHLHPDYRGRTITGEVLAEGVLERAGVRQADGLAAVTNVDAVNAVVGHLARTTFAVPLVVVRNYGPRLRVLHEAFGLQSVGSTAWGAQRMEEMLLAVGQRPLLSAGQGEVELFEMAVPVAWAGRRLREVLPEGCLAAALTRAGRAELPGGETRLAAGDRLHLSATAAGVAALRAGERKEGA